MILSFEIIYTPHDPYILTIALNSKKNNIEKKIENVDESTLLQAIPSSYHPIIRELIEHEKRYRARHDIVPAKRPLFSYFHLGGRGLQTCIQMLAATGNLFKDTKRITCDLFRPVSCTFSLEENGSIASLFPRLYKDNKQIQYTTLDIFKGPPHIVIHDTFLSFFNDELDWVFIEKLKNPSLAHEELKSFKKEYSALITTSSTANLEEHTLPKPSLYLCDRTGSYAYFKLQYGNIVVSPYWKDSSHSDIRDKESEKTWDRDLEDSGYKKRNQAHGDYFCPSDQVQQVLKFLLELGWTIIDFDQKPIILEKESTFSFNHSVPNVTLTGSFTYEDEQIDITKIKIALQRQQSTILLQNGKKGLLDIPKDLEKIILQDTILIEGALSVHKRALGAVAKCIHNSQITISKELHTFFATEYVSTQEMPSYLRSYQKEAVAWLQKRYHANFSALVADDMGLGKTVQILAFLQTILKREPHLIIVPTSLLFQWKTECTKFYPAAKVSLYWGKERHAHFQEYDIILTTPQMIRQDFEMFIQQTFHCLIFDEAQQIKNSDTKLAQALFQIHAHMRISLTGTPLENSIDELWTQFRFLEPDLFPNLNEFRDLAVQEGLNSIKARIQPFWIRRKKEEVAKDLPEKIEQTVFIEMEEDQKALYYAFIKHLQSGLLKKIQHDGISAHKMEVLEAILRLRQIVCHPSLIPTIAESLDFNPMHIKSTKFEIILDDIQALIQEGQKILVFSQFSSLIALFEKALIERDIDPLLLTGETQNRDTIVSSFQNDAKKHVLLMTLKAGGVGLNLTEADSILIVDPWWNIAQEEQAIARAHRIGRTKTVFCKRYITRNTIEENIQKLQSVKKQLYNALFEEGALEENTHDLEQLLFNI